MGRVKIDQEILGLSSLMQKITRAKVVDCFHDPELIYFVVAQGEMGKALGKGAVNVKRLSQEIGKKVRIVEFSSQAEKFVKNLIYPLQVEKIIIGEGIIEIQDSNKKTKSLLIGRGGKQLALINRAVKRFFNSEVKII